MICSYFCTKTHTNEEREGDIEREDVYKIYIYVFCSGFCSTHQRRRGVSYIDNAKTKLPREAIQKGSRLPREAKLRVQAS